MDTPLFYWIETRTYFVKNGFVRLQKKLINKCIPVFLRIRTAIRR